MVDPDVVDDDEAAVIAQRTAKAVEKELDFPAGSGSPWSGRAARAMRGLTAG